MTKKTERATHRIEVLEIYDKIKKRWQEKRKRDALEDWKEEQRFEYCRDMRDEILISN